MPKEISRNLIFRNVFFILSATANGEVCIAEFLNFPFQDFAFITP
jgi:hypothetical protein